MKKVLQVLKLLALLSIVPAIFIIINYYANGGTLLDSIKEVFKVLGYILLGILVIGGIPGLIRVFMEDALKDKNSRAYKVFIEINAASILFIIIIGIAFFLPPIINAFKIFFIKNFYWFIAFVSSIIFSGYWWWLKKTITSIDQDKNLESEPQAAKTLRKLTLMRKLYNNPEMTEQEMLENIEKAKQFKANKKNYHNER